MIPLMKHAFCNEFETREALSRFILQAPRLSMGEQCAQFESQFASYHGRAEAVLFNSGGSANLAILQALRNMGRLRVGDKVAFSALTWSTNTMPIIQMGMIPVPIDCEPTTLNCMSSHLLDRLQQTDIQAFFITNALGLTGDLPQIRDICKQRGILLLEDNCESLGTVLPEGRTGNFGLCASFSFFVAHHMSTIEGGMVCTDDLELAEMLRIVRANGWDRNLTAVQQQRWRKKHHIASEIMAKYSFYDLAFNLRPTEITGFLGQQQLKLLDQNLSRRAEIYRRLDAVLQTNSDLVQLNIRHIQFLSPFAFVVLCKSVQLRDHYLYQFAGAGVELRPVIAGNMQKQPFYSKYVDKHYDLPGTDVIHDCGFYFGIYPELTNDEIEVLSSCLLAQ